ncbi:hypothetical protein HQ533_00965 [Candidatus Woesearchaeota archaeon]|nr:hypothetical protein [Candidatus Woesearchaeota archaeon]
MTKKQVSTRKVKKKKWYPIIAPKLFGNKVLGESLLTDSSLMKGRHMTLNLSNITGNPRTHNTNIQFVIKDVRDGQGITEVIKYSLITGVLKRLVRRGRNKVDNSFILRTGDGKRVRIKIIMITNSYIHKSTGTKLRAAARDVLREIIAKNTFEKTIEDLLRADIQKECKKKISKIAPVRNFEVRVFKLEAERREVEEKKEEISETEAQSSEATSAPKDELLSVSDDAQKPEVSDKVKVMEEVKEEKVEEKEAVKEVSEKKVSDDAQKPEVSDKVKEETVDEAKEEKKAAPKKPVPKKKEAKKEVKKPAPKKKEAKKEVKKPAKKVAKKPAAKKTAKKPAAKKTVAKKTVSKKK